MVWAHVFEFVLLWILAVVWGPHLTAAHRTSIVRCCNFTVKVVLVGWRNQALLLIIRQLFVLSSWNVNLLSLSTHWRLYVYLVVLYASGVHSLVIDQVNAVIC